MIRALLTPAAWIRAGSLIDFYEFCLPALMLVTLTQAAEKVR